MPLILGIPFTACLALLVAWLSNRFGMELYWALAAASGIWAWLDSRRHGLQRYERIFPLEPRAAGFAVALAWPVAFPWYLRLRHRALTGRLDGKPLRRSHAGLAAVLGVTGVLVAAFLLWLPHSIGSISVVSQQLQRITDDAVEVSLFNGRELTITVVNSAIPAEDQEGQRHQAWRLAREASSAYSPKRGLKLVKVRYIRREQVGARVEAEEEARFEWPVSELDGQTWLI
jgi:hypothetical protein